MVLGLKKKKWKSRGFLFTPEGRTYVLLVLGIIALGYLTFLGGTATRSADDFWYSSFFRGSTKDFFALTQEHYMTFNGRALIHMVAQYILYRGNGAFAVLMFFLMGVAPLLAGEIGEKTWGQRLGAALVFWLGVAVLPVEMTRQSLTWISAFCNYVLPAVMVLLQIKLLFRFAQKGGIGWGILCCLQSLLCGATTEQSGTIALCVALFSVFYCIFKGWKRALTGLCAALCAFGGVATVFASPATQLRVDLETNGLEALGYRLFLGLRDQSKLFFRYTELQILVGLLLALLIFLAVRNGKKQLAWLAGGALAGYGIALLVGYQDSANRPWAYLACLCTLLLGALVLWLLGHHQWGAILLCGLASLLIILPTRSNAPRTMFPAVIYLLAALGQLVGEAVSEKEKSWWLYPALFGLAAYLVCPQIPIYWKNHQVETLNRTYVDAAQETRVLYHCMDYNVEYTYTKAHVDGYTYAHFLMAEGFTVGEDEIYFYGSGLPKVYVNGKRASSPALKGEGGNWLLPLRDIIEGLGGLVRNDYELYVALGDYQCCLNSYGSGAMQFRSRISTPEMTYSWHRGVAERAVGHYCMCVSEFFFTDYLGIEIEFREDEEAGAFYVTFPEEADEIPNGMA